MEKYVSLEEYKDMYKSALEFASKHRVSTQCEVDGIKLPQGCDHLIGEFKTLEVRDDDVWVITYPKAGTTWAQEIVSCLMLDGDMEEINTRHTSFRVPHVELTLPEPIRNSKNLPPTHKIVDEMPSPRVLKSHLPGKFLPPQLRLKKPRIVYVLRNPKDLLVSFFYFIKMIDPERHGMDGPFEVFFDKMLAGRVVYGPWWEHYLYFWKMRNQPNVLILHYEDMLRDLRGNVEKIGRFLGKDLSAEKLDAITEHCTFANMKKNPMSDPGYIMNTITGNADFLRKGKKGSWKSHFTVEQNEIMDAHIREKLQGSGLEF